MTLSCVVASSGWKYGAMLPKAMCEKIINSTNTERTITLDPNKMDFGPMTAVPVNEFIAITRPKCKWLALMTLRKKNELDDHKYIIISLFKIDQTVIPVSVKAKTNSFFIVPEAERARFPPFGMLLEKPKKSAKSKKTGAETTHIPKKKK